MNIEDIRKVAQQYDLVIAKRDLKREGAYYYIHRNGKAKCQKFLGTLEKLTKLSKEQIEEKIEEKLVLVDMAAKKDEKINTHSKQDVMLPQPSLAQIERKKITLACWKDGRQISIELAAYVCGGLALHTSVGFGGGHTITHIKDSVAVRQNILHSHIYRLDVLKDLASLTDWNRPYHEVANDLVSNQELHAKYKALIEKLAPGKEPSPCGRHHPTR